MGRPYSHTLTDPETAFFETSFCSIYVGINDKTRHFLLKLLLLFLCRLPLSAVSAVVCCVCRRLPSSAVVCRVCWIVRCVPACSLPWSAVVVLCASGNEAKPVIYHVLVIGWILVVWSWSLNSGRAVTGASWSFPPQKRMVWADVPSVVYGLLCLPCLLCGPACSLPVCRFVWCVVGLFVVVGLWRGCGHVCGVVVSGLCVCLLMFDITIFITMNANLLGVWFFGILAFRVFGLLGFWLFGISVFGILTRSHFLNYFLVYLLLHPPLGPELPHPQDFIVGSALIQLSVRRAFYNFFFFFLILTCRMVIIL